MAETLAKGNRPGLAGLEDHVRQAVRDCPDIVSLAVSDATGLPIVDATTGGADVMTFTAMATLSLRAATTASLSVGLGVPEYVHLHTATGEFLLVRMGEGVCVAARLAPGAGMGRALDVLRRLAAQITGVLYGEGAPARAGPWTLASS
ncbi:MAG TPA: hypothetical protein VJ397_08675 [Thermoplasmata archaeon]|nr:hypothetical protein [Thermoplasmata archaeon]